MMALTRTVPICLVIGWFSIASFGGVTPIDVTRPKLDRLLTKDTCEDDDFQFPYLISVKGRAYEMSAEGLANNVRTFLRKSELQVGNFKSPILPKEALTGKQLDGIMECSAEYCLMKLNNKEELPLLQGAGNRLATYTEMIGKRIERFLTSRELPGYEGRDSNVGQLKDAFLKLPFLTSQYPIAGKFVHEGLWKQSGQPKEAILRAEIVILNSDKLQPVLRVGNVFEIKDSKATVFVDIHIYTNHYFDSSLRVIEILPLPPLPKSDKLRAAAVMTDIVEIDELKKSALIRSLFTGQMLRAVASVQYNELKEYAH
jgi:hypothetical protein